MNIWVIIPAFNESGSIAGVIRQIKSKNLSLIVVDDGSTDSTSHIIEEERVDVFLKNKSNQGKGSAVKQAVYYVIENIPDCNAVIIMDADAQHSAEELDLFVSRLKQGSFFINGNRMQNPGNMPFLRVLTNMLMSLVISLITKQRIYDSQCGFKAISRKVLEKITIKSSKYEIDSELILETAKAGYKIDSLPVKSIYSREKSNINPFWDTIRFIIFIISRR